MTSAAATDNFCHLPKPSITSYNKQLFHLFIFFHSLHNFFWHSSCVCGTLWMSSRKDCLKVCTSFPHLYNYRVSLVDFINSSQSSRDWWVMPMWRPASFLLTSRGKTPLVAKRSPIVWKLMRKSPHFLFDLISTTFDHGHSEQDVERYHLFFSIYKERTW